MYSVLIVDDNPADREGVRDLVPWEEWDMRVVGEASDGSQGLKLAMELRPDVIFTDVSMPVLDGIQMVSEIRRELPDTGIVFMSCFDDFNYIKSALNLDVYGYILKPIDLEELEAVICKMRDSKELQIKQNRVQQELQRQLSESMPERRERYFERLLHQHATDTEIRNKMTGFQMTPSERCTVIYIQLDDFVLAGRDLPIERRSMLSQTIRDKAEKAVFLPRNGVILHQEFNGLAGVLFAAKDAGLFEQELLQEVERFHRFMAGQMMLNMTIGISDSNRDFSLIPEMYEQAREMARAKFYHGGNRIVQQVDFPEKKGRLEFQIQDIRDALVQLLEQPDEQARETFLDRVFNTEYSGIERTYKGLTLSVLNLLQTILLEKSENLLPAVGDLGQLLEKIESFETMDEIRQWIGGILDEIGTQLNGDAGRRYMQIVNDIRSLIETHYSTELTAEQIAERLHLSVSHANAIYKKHTSHSIFESLVQYRMDAAKRLLRDPYVKIYEVAEMVGYRNKSYFSAVFREYTGLSPRQYMDSHSERV